MTELLRVRNSKSEEEFEVADVEPTATAQRFKKISDKIWSQKPTHNILASHGLETVVDPLVARDLLNGALAEIDTALVLSGADKQVPLPGRWRGDELTVLASELDRPQNVGVITYNWDERNKWRSIERDGEAMIVEVLDGNYYRALDVSLYFRDAAAAPFVLTYEIGRVQERQDQPTWISMNLWHSNYAETGYEGSQLAYESLTLAQEDGILDVIQTIGGIAIDSKKS